MKVLIIDDHDIVRAGLRQILLEGKPHIDVEEVGTAREALARVRQEDYDVVLLDISLPDKSGMEVLKSIRHLGNKTPVLILSIHAADQYAVRAFRNGANGYLNKEVVTDELLKAFNKVSSGGRYVSEDMADMLIDIVGGDADAQAPHLSLSDREFDVMSGIATGESLTQIGERLNLSVKTISTYRSRVLSKMKFKNNSDITRYAINTGLI